MRNASSVVSVPAVGLVADPVLLDCRACGGSGQGEALSHHECRRCDDCSGTGVRTCDAPGCYEAAVVAPDGNADYCEACGYRIASKPLRTFVLAFFAIEVVS